MGKEEFRIRRGRLWYWFVRSSAIGCWIFIVIAFTDKGFIKIFAESLAGFSWVAGFMLFSYLVVKEVLKYRNREVIAQVEINKDTSQPAKVLLADGSTLILYRQDVKRDTGTVKSIIGTYGDQPLEVWNNILSAYNKNDYNGYGQLKGYCLTQIQRIKKANQAPIKLGQEVILQ